MAIDEDKKHILTTYEQVRKGGKATDTDHATEYIDIDLIDIDIDLEIRSLRGMKYGTLKIKKLKNLSNLKLKDFQTASKIISL